VGHGTFLHKKLMKRLKKHKATFYRNLLDYNLSVFPIIEKNGQQKPNGSWKHYQTDIAGKEQINEWYDNAVAFALITGYGDVEAIDVDTKVLKTQKDKDIFVDEYFGLLENHIIDFWNKVSLVETQSGGYHLIYRCEDICGATKIAKPKGASEALIESRGIGGFVYIYDVVKGLPYHEINYITVEERKLIWEISKMYHHEDKVIDVKFNKKVQQKTDGLKSWEDFANKNSVWDICSEEFDIVRRLSRSVMIKRKGAESFYSGHIYNDTGKMFLFSTGTIYPHEQPLNSFDVYTYKYHHGDYSAAAKQAYADGYGDRVITEVDIDEPIEIPQNLSFPLHIFPTEIRNYIMECNNKLNASIDFMSVSFLWLISVIVGNSMKVRVKNGWVDSPILWISVIGDAGVGKTPDIKLILKPLLDLNSHEIKTYIKRQKEFSEYEQMDKEDKKHSEKIKPPKKSQFIVDDITIESLIDIHANNPKSIGVFKDELAGWFKDMNKYRDGSDKERYLSAWSGDSIVLNRKTADDAFVENPFIPILGGIQPSIFREFQTSENQSNGFMDRMLFCDPKKQAQYLSDDDLDQTLIDNYRDRIISVKNYVDNSMVDGEPNILNLTDEARNEFKRINKKLVDLQNSEDELSSNKGMFAKQLTYVPRFALLLQFINDILQGFVPNEITEESMVQAGELSDYFISMAKINKIENINSDKLAEFAAKHKEKPNKDLIAIIIKNFPDATNTKIAEVLGISRKTVTRNLK